MRSSFCAKVWMSAMALLWFAARAHAQTGDPDIRDIQPFVMVIVDSSGSMERLPNCKCTTLGCTECLPNCSLSNDPTTHEAPAGKKNRWATVLEALTGKFDNFACKQLPRLGVNGMTYDIGYTIPYHQPWLCAGGVDACPYPGTATQLNNGLLDNYVGRLRFGLMTFDGMATYAGAADLVPAATFTLNQTLSDTDPGSWSYAGPKRIHYPTCTTDYMMDTGVRGPNSTEGGLISLGWAKCATPPCDIYQTNAAIQDSLVKTRSFGGTPIASSLDDLYYHFKNDIDDKYKSCRGRYAVLITDGYPDDDYRKYPWPGCNCNSTTEHNCSGDPTEWPNMHCPYPTADDAAYNLIHGVNGDPPQMQQLFVVGMSIDDDTAKGWLNSIASHGGSIDTDGDHNEAFFANDPTTLTATLDSLFGGLSKPVSRSTPAFATGMSGAQYQVSAGFQVSSDRPVSGIAPPWTGILERRRFVCDGTTLTSPSLDSSLGDRFHEVLNARTTSRVLFTAMPSASSTTAVLEGQLDRVGTGALCGSDCQLFDLKTQVTYQQFGLTASADKQPLMDWMYGENSSVRVGKRLGDIYHSSPTVIGQPTEDPGDESYTLFRQSAVVTERPTTMYIGTNDGILHAFSVEDYPTTTAPLTVHPGQKYGPGAEMWGFVPPILLNNLNAQLSSHQMSMDGTPVVKDVFFSKGSTALATDYHTVLITGMRGGGNAYIALDVTDPVKPKFLWQFTDADMGLTYGQAEIVQAYYEWPKGSSPTQRAMAILPGGVGSKSTTAGCTTSAMHEVGNPSKFYTTRSDLSGSSSLKHRVEVQCWKQPGRALYFIDVETGQLIKKIIDDDNDRTNGMVFPSPLSGSPTAYQDAVGLIATEGFVIDADGVMWRIDLSASDPRPNNEPYAGWTVRPFHDLFWDLTPTDGETTYERPILSLDDQHQLVVITGTGDSDNFDKPTVKNRVVSLTEVATKSSPSGPADYIAALNWEHRVIPSTDTSFVPSELVTGTMALFGGQLYLASFISVVSSSNACDFGRGRLWAFNYNTRDSALVNNSSSGNPLTYGPKRLPKPDTSLNGADSGATLFNIDVATAEPNLLIQGLGATQRVTCQPSVTDLSTYFSPGLVPIAQSSPPAVWIVAQASSNTDSRKRAGSLLGSLEVKVTRPQSFSKVVSWAGSID